MSALEQSEPRPDRRFRDWLGFSPVAMPVIVVLGLAYLMVSVPGLFGQLAQLDIGPTYLRTCLDFLWQTAHGWAEAIRIESFNDIGSFTLRASLFAIPVLWLAALVRSAVVRTWSPFGITAIASAVGVIGIPVATWIGEVAVVVWRIAGYIGEFIASLLPWIVRVLGWVIGAALAVAVVVGIGYAIYQFVAYLRRHNRWVVFGLVLLAVGGLAAAIYAGWLDTFLAWLGDLLSDMLHWLAVWIERIVGWVVEFLAPIVRWVVQAFIIAVVFMLILGTAVGTLGQAGRTVYLPFTSAFRAGRDQGKCADLAAGTGVTMSLVLTAAVLDPSFGEWFSQLWRATPMLNLIPDPIAGYDVLLPNAAEGILQPAFTGYLPIVDVCLLLLVAAIGAVSLFFGPAKWENEYGSRIAVPIVLAVGAAIALALIVIALLLVAAAAFQDSS